MTARQTPTPAAPPAPRSCPAPTDTVSGPPPPNRQKRRLRIGSLGLLLLTALVVALLLLRHHISEAKQRKELNRVQAAGPRLAVTRVELGAPTRQITLPGDVHGYYQITLYPKVSGYLVKIFVERGDRVKQDQVLAVLQSPENDQDVISTGADLEVKRRNAQ